MAIRVLTIAFVVALAAGCGRDPEEAKVQTALRATVAALRVADWHKLWEVSAPAAQKQVLDLNRKLHAALAEVDAVYPPSERAAARRALGEKLVGDIAPNEAGEGPKLLARLLDPKALRFDEKARDGLYASGATIDGAQAIIHTAADEVFTFQRDGGRWRSRLIMDILNHSHALRTLAENADAVLAAAKARHAAWTSSRDPRQPQGAYNLARRALAAKPIDTTTLYALLDAPAREALIDALKTARKAQRIIQRRTTRARRRAAYAAHGLTLYVKAASDRALYAAWAKHKGFVPPVPVAAPPVKLDGDASAGTARVVTAEGEKIPMVRDARGYWHLANVTAAIEAKLVVPARAALSALGEKKKR